MEGLQQFLPFILIFVVIYFFMIRPQMKRQKKEKKFAADIKRGDKVVTKGGMHGKIADFSEKLNAVILETGAGKITVDQSYISMELSEKLQNPEDSKAVKGKK